MFHLIAAQPKLITTRGFGLLSQVFFIAIEAAILLKDKEEYDAHKTSDGYKLRENHNEFLSKPTGKIITILYLWLVSQ